jgi:hypothetical protein
MEVNGKFHAATTVTSRLYQRKGWVSRRTLLAGDVV